MVSFFTSLPSIARKVSDHKHWQLCGWSHLLSCISLHCNLQIFFFYTNKLPIHRDYPEVLKFGFALLCLFQIWAGKRQLISVTIVAPPLGGFWEGVLYVFACRGMLNFISLTKVKHNQTQSTLQRRLYSSTYHLMRWVCCEHG